MDMHIFTTEASAEYELLDSGNGEKLERYGSFAVSRPDPQALWEKRLSQNEWQKADARFDTTDKKGVWRTTNDLAKRWQISFEGLKFWIKPSSFKHTGLFPEQAANWAWIREKIRSKMIPLSRKGEGQGVRSSEKEPTSPNLSLPGEENRRTRVLNLFGYTGGATLVALQAGAEVVHVDGSKVAVTWARENADASGLKEKPVRWIVDDAAAFVEREVRRGSMYDAIIMDPPAFGRGPEGEVWKIEENFLPFLASCKKILSPNPLFVLVNGYAAGYSALSYGTVLQDLMKDRKGAVEIGELTIKESKSDRRLPAGIVARWSGN